MTDIDLVRAGIDLVATLGFLWFAYRFYQLNGAFVISMYEMGELIVLLANYTKIESPEERIRRLATLLDKCPDDVRIQVEQGEVMRLIGIKAASIMSHMKASVPGSIEAFAPMEETLGR